MADTGFRRANNVDSNSGFTLSNFVGNSTGTATTATFNILTVSDFEVVDGNSSNNTPFSSTIPSDATIVGIEFQFTYKGTGGWSITVGLGGVPGSGAQIIGVTATSTYQTVVRGGPSSLLGRTLTPSNVDNLTLTFQPSPQGGTSNLILGGSSTADLSPAIKIYYRSGLLQGFNIASGQLSINSGQLYIRE